MGSYFEDRMAELKANPPKRKWLIDGPLPKEGMSHVFRAMIDAALSHD